MQPCPYPDSQPRYKNIRLILEAGQDKKEKSNAKSSPPSSESVQHTFVRGAVYYGGGSHEE